MIPMNSLAGMSLEGKTAIVTGSGRGLGEATALRLAALGADVAVNDIDPANARKVAEAIEKQGRRAIVSTHDISDNGAAHALVAETRSKLGRVDILVNNAGITRDSMLHKLTVEKWDEVIRVNLTGSFNMGQACAKVMMEQNSGRIINLSSVAWLGNIGQTNYAASKAGVVGLTHTWAIELARYNITCNAIAPGIIDSVLTRQIPDEVRQKFIAKIPLKRIGAPEDIANLVSFLASDLASYITGQVIQIDGGLSTGI